MPESIYNPFSGQEEILFKDKDGKIKVLHQGLVKDLNSLGKTAGNTVKPAAVKAEDRLVSINKIDNFEKIIDEVINESRLNLTDQVLAKRFRNAILSRLKEVRNALETRESLMRPAKVGGLDFTAEQAEQVVKIVESKIQKSPDAKPVTMENQLEELESNINQMLKPAAAPMPPIMKMEPAKKVVPPPIPPPEIQSQAAPDQTIQQKLGSKLFPPKSQPAIKATSGSEQIIKNIPPRPLMPMSPILETKIKPAERLVPIDRGKVYDILPKPKIAKPPIATALPVTPPPKIEPVTFRPKLVGPIEELASLTLPDFRQLDPSPAMATKKVLEKMELLEKESFAKKILAIKAWRQSPIFKTYTQMGTMSMESKTPVKDLIIKMKAENKPVLNISEFEAIMDLNHKLRF